MCCWLGWSRCDATEGCDGAIDVGAWRAWSFWVCQAMRGGAIHQMGANPRDLLLKAKSLQNKFRRPLPGSFSTTNFSTNLQRCKPWKPAVATAGGTPSLLISALPCAGIEILNGEREYFGRSCCRRLVNIFCVCLTFHGTETHRTATASKFARACRLHTIPGRASVDSEAILKKPASPYGASASSPRLGPVGSGWYGLAETFHCAS